MKSTYLHIAPERDPPRIESRPFRAVLIAEQSVGQAWRDRVATWLVESGCLYVISWGVECEAWHDSVDRAALEAFDFGEIPDDRFVMTSWHDRESLSEAFWFAGYCARHPHVDLRETMIVHMAQEERATDILDAYRSAQEAGAA